MTMRNNTVRTAEGLAAQRRTTWAERRDIVLTILGWIAVLIFVSLVLRRFSEVVLVAAIAAVFAFGLSPPVRVLERAMPRFLAIIIVYLIFTVAILALGYLVVNTAIHQVPSLVQAVQRFLAPSGSAGVSGLAGFLHGLGVSQQQLGQFNQQITQQLEGIALSVIPIATGVFTYLVDFVLIIVLSIYFLIDGERVIGLIRSNAPLSAQSQVNFMLSVLHRVVGGYIRGQLMMSTLIGLLVWAGMTIIGVPYPQLLGLLAFFLEFVPILGTLVSGAVCVLLALSNGFIIAGITLAYFVVVHIIEGDVLGPRIVGRNVGLHPAVSILAVVAGAQLDGVVGALLASPVAGIIQAVLVAAWEDLKLAHADEFKEIEDEAKSDVGKIEEKAAAVDRDGAP